MNEKKYFITFEGAEGSGKSTQINILSEHLNEKKIDHIITREPGGTALAEKLREIVVCENHDSIDAITEYLLFSAARRDHIQKVIKPALTQGKWVICDRFYDSSLVYQGYAQNVSIDFLDTIYNHITEGKIKPDLTFIFNIDFKIGLDRTKSRLNNDEIRFEKKGELFHQKIQNGFIKLIKDNPNRCISIDAELKINEVSQNILSNIKKFI